LHKQRKPACDWLKQLKSLTAVLAKNLQKGGRSLLFPSSPLLLSLPSQ